MPFPHLSESIPRFATPGEFAELFGFNVESIRRQLREGRLPGVQISRRWFVDMEAISEQFPSQKREMSA